jgi:hypothetical protein
MPAKSTRYAAAGIVLLATVAIGRAQVAPSAAAYRDAIRVYVKTGEPALAVKRLAGWDQKALVDAVAETIKSGDPGVNEAAALLHLEIGVAIAGISTASSALNLSTVSTRPMLTSRRMSARSGSPRSRRCAPPGTASPAARFSR